jgi:hypothetical protein
MQEVTDLNLEQDIDYPLPGYKRQNLCNKAKEIPKTSNANPSYGEIVSHAVRAGAGNH